MKIETDPFGQGVSKRGEQGKNVKWELMTNLMSNLLIEVRFILGLEEIPEKTHTGTREG